MNPISKLIVTLFVALSLLLTGCISGQQSQPTVEQTDELELVGASSNGQTIQIVVWDDKTQRPLPRAKVRLITPSQTFQQKETDNNGVAIFIVSPDTLKEVGEFVVSLDGYQVQRQNISLQNASVITIYLVPEGETAVPRETPSATPIPPTPKPNDTPTSSPTATNTPTPTNTPTATATKIPFPEPSADEITLRRKDGADTVFVLAGPDVSNTQLGTLAVDEMAEVIGRTEQDEWLQIVTARNVEGWVANCEVVLSSENLDSIPITWDGAVTAKNCSNDGSGTSTVNSGSCVEVTLTRTDWPSKEFDDVMLNWLNVPASAIKLKLSVSGPTNDGGTDYVVDPTFSDTDIGYKVELFMFEDGDFKPGATYTYVVQPINGSGEIICTTQDTFIP